MNQIIRYQSCGKLFLIFISIFLVTTLTFTGCSPRYTAPAPLPSPAPAPSSTPTPSPALTPVTRINTIDEACSVVDNYLYSLANTPEAKILLAVYKDNMWSPHSCVVVVDYTHHSKLMYLESDYEGWDVKQYIIHHIFDSEFEPGSEALKQILKSEPCIYGCGPDNETTYPVTWVVDTYTRTVTPGNGNALRVEAAMMK